MHINGSRYGKRHEKNKKMEMEKIFHYKDDRQIFQYDRDRIIEINDFEVAIEIAKDPKSMFGDHCVFYSKTYGMLSSFPWEDNYDQKMLIMSESDIPIGKEKTPYIDMEQGWEIWIFTDNKYVYVFEGGEPGENRIHNIYKVKHNDYLHQWLTLIDKYKTNTKV